MKRVLQGICLLTMLTGVLFVVGCSHPETKVANTWNQKTAAAYLDQRESWWMDWPVAARDHETFCISCHTAVPYALSRPALREVLGELEFAFSRGLLRSVRTRPDAWYAIETIRCSACFTISTNQAALPIEGCPLVFHMDQSMLRRSRWLTRILTPFIAIIS